MRFQSTNACFLLLLAASDVMVVTTGCSRDKVRVSTPPGITRNDNSYIDLQPGSALRIVVPQTKSGGFVLKQVPEESNGNTVSLSAADLIGYMTLRYAVTGKKNSAVRVKFLSAEETRDGKTVPVKDVPSLPFEFPRKAEYLRLIYLVRVSQADHNMVIVGSKHLDGLNAFTETFKENPSVCKISDDIFCSWVPAGIAVRAEKQ